MEITNVKIDYHYNQFTANILPFGSMDIRIAIQTALEVGEDGYWVAETVREFTESCEVKIEDCDVVCCVYDTILQEARNEIDNLTNFDFVNDDAEISTYGNYCATSYDWSGNANEVIRDKLIENNIIFADLSVKTQWFLNEIEVNY